MFVFAPVILTFFLLALHYMHMGSPLLVVASLAAPLLLLVRKRIALRVGQLLLVIAASVFLLRIPGSMANALHPPVALAILSVEAVLALTSAWLLNRPRIVRMFP